MGIDSGCTVCGAFYGSGGAVPRLACRTKRKLQVHGQRGEDGHYSQAAQYSGPAKAERPPAQVAAQHDAGNSNKKNRQKSQRCGHGWYLLLCFYRAEGSAFSAVSLD